MKFKVLITTSGLGSRLGEFTKFTNKALIRIKDKPVISYIVESYPKTTEFVVTLGYFGDHVRQFLEIAYPDRKFTFVNIDNYEGKGSSLLHSMLKAKRYLQCPFIFHASDTLVYEKIPCPSVNWNGGFKGTNGALYRSFDVMDREIVKFYDKGMIKPDFLHIGLVGVHDYKTFWKEAKKGGETDVSVIEKMNFKVVEFKEWSDTGNVQSLYETWEKFNDLNRVMDKTGESTFFINGYVIKFFSDERTVWEKVVRANYLKGFVPEVIASSNNFFKYKYVKGELLADICTPKEFKKFLDWLETKFWTVDNKPIWEECQKFYLDKTLERVITFLNSHNLIDKEDVINGIKVPTISFMLKDLCDVYDGFASRFHGDLILDNVIKTKKGYTLLDWRQNFAGDLEVGDMYYDLAKLNHNLTINHNVVNKGLFTVKINKNEVFVDILRSNRLVECQNVLKPDRELNILTALIWLNMSPLHQHPFDLFLYYFGKYKLWEAIRI
jgi:NDP-sugar pyrophosphorylase family protein